MATSAQVKFGRRVLMESTASVSSMSRTLEKSASGVQKRTITSGQSLVSSPKSGWNSIHQEISDHRQPHGDAHAIRCNRQGCVGGPQELSKGRGRDDCKSRRPEQDWQTHHEIVGGRLSELNETECGF